MRDPQARLVSLSSLPSLRQTDSLSLQLDLPRRPSGLSQWAFNWGLGCSEDFVERWPDRGIKQSSVGLIRAGHLRGFPVLMCFAQLSRMYLPP